MDTAVRDGLLGASPASKLKRPTVTSAEARALAPHEVDALLRAAEGTRYEHLLRVLAGTGLRRGEALALRWSEVDLTRRLVTVRGTLARTREGLEVQPPKTERSRRTIPVSTATAAVLSAVRASQDEARARSEGSWRESGLVFTTEFGGPIDPRNASRAMSTAAKNAGLHGVGIHTLRHTAASTMLEAGVPLRTVSEILGHASVQVTGDIYGHVSTEGARAAVDRLASSLGW
ncbi:MULTISPECIES: site-specific integrase [Georgenia]|uniref:tyrosine-type recombinase/integrase n=1 Tax=Georgenia TaxID=154116 RepID=UPI00143DCE54|nr:MULTISPECIES: site-specific integrase [Georgenia]